MEIPYGYCHCGCENKTPLAPHTDKNRGMVRGVPNRFLNGHARRIPRSSIPYRKVLVDGSPCVEVPLTKGLFALIDEDDLSVVSDHKWYAEKSDNTLYARSSTGGLMHRLISKNPPNDIDHWDRNGLNNRRDNLRPATVSQNKGNTGLMSTNTSGFKGIWFDKTMKLWMSEIGSKEKRKRLGYSQTAEEAARVYDKAALEYFGKFAVLNFPTISLPQQSYPTA